MCKKICVIGAGAAGLITAKHCLNEGHDVTIYEQSGEIGGTWVYSEETGCHSSMYKSLKTNLSKESMAFQDVPFRSDLPSFMSREHVLEYLQEFSKSLAVSVNSRVESVRRDAAHQKWAVRTTRHATRLFDAVFVCNGHFAAPFNPFHDASRFTGTLLHSHDYRTPEPYRCRSVAVIGAGPSGVDIALQLSDTAREVHLVSNKADYPSLPNNIVQHKTHCQRIFESGIVTETGMEIQVEVIILCTGYIFEFPFFEESLVRVRHNGLMVSPLYEHICHVDYPQSLFFIGIPLGTITFQLFEIQAKFALSILSRRAHLPTADEMRNFEPRRLRSISDPSRFHVLVDEQWDYIERLIGIGRFEKWEYLETIRNIFLYIINQRKNNVVGYKNMNFIMSEDHKDFQVEQF